MSSEEFGAAVAAAAIALGVIAMCVWTIVASLRKREVLTRSSALLSLSSLNAEYHPLLPQLTPISYSWVDRVSSKAKFDRYNLDQYLLDRLAAFEADVQRDIDLRLATFRTYSEYSVAYQALRDAELGKSASAKLRAEAFNRVEAKLFSKRVLRAPNCTAQVTCTVNYTSPKGQNSYTKSIQSDFDQLRRALSDMRRIREARGTTQFLRARERSKMTTSMRTDVLRRDEFRCRMCGRSASDGVKLHVDHVVAVSNGGKTTLRNLQTLCEDCNLGKSNRF